jgi:hypothetical protein
VILATGALLNGSRPELAHTTLEGSKGPESSAPITLEEAERSYILQTLEQTKGVTGGVGMARPSGWACPRTTLISKMKQLATRYEDLSLNALLPNVRMCPNLDKCESIIRRFRDTHCCSPRSTRAQPATMESK